MSGIRKKLLPLISLFLAAAVVAGLFGGLGQAAAKDTDAAVSETGSRMAAKTEKPIISKGGPR